ncbi:MAG: discoidin domain-containing protein [Anaerolineae bacterium]|nr:discoidin domain-containing protein [Anaerolineae bacterium]
MSIPPALYNRLRTTLLHCGPFATQDALEAVFVDARISQWAADLPEARSDGARVQATIKYLLGKRDDNDAHALILLLRVLREQIPSTDARHQELADLADELAMIVLEDKIQYQPTDRPKRKSFWTRIVNAFRYPVWLGISIVAAIPALILIWSIIQTPSTSPTPTQTPTYTSTPTLMPVTQATPTTMFTPEAVQIPTNTPPATFTPSSTPDPCMKEEKNGNGGTDIITLPGDECFGNRIQIDLLVRGTIYGFSFWEVQAYGPDDSEMQNPLITKDDIVCASSIQEQNLGYYHPGKAIDTDLSSRWSSEPNEPESFIIILSEPKYIKSIVVTWQEAFAVKYRITVSNKDEECPYELP